MFIIPEEQTTVVPTLRELKKTTTDYTTKRNVEITKITGLSVKSRVPQEIPEGTVSKKVVS